MTLCDYALACATLPGWRAAQHGKQFTRENNFPALYEYGENNFPSGKRQRIPSMRPQDGGSSMTIGVGFLCHDGIVLATDTQYTAGLLKTEGPKLFTVIERSDAVVIAAGAGSVPFMKMAITAIGDKIKLLPVGSVSSTNVVDMVRAVLLDTYARHVYPVPGEQPIFSFLVGLWTNNDGLTLLETCLTSVNTVDSFGFVGVGVYVAEYALGLMHRGGVGVEEAKFLAVHSIKAAKDYVADCGKSTRMQVLSLDGKLTRISPPEIKDTEEYCEDLSNALRTFTMGLDTDIEAGDVNTLTSFFTDAIRELRDKKQARKLAAIKRGEKMAALRQKARDTAKQQES